MELTRRDFFKFSAAGAGAAWATFGFDLEPAYAQASELKISRAKEIRSVCPYCGVGCSMIAYVAGHGETTSFNTKPYLVHIEGCLLYTSDAADDLLCVDLGGRRII